MLVTRKTVEEGVGVITSGVLVSGAIMMEVVGVIIRVDGVMIEGVNVLIGGKKISVEESVGVGVIRLTVEISTVLVSLMKTVVGVTTSVGELKMAVVVVSGKRISVDV